MRGMTRWSVERRLHSRRRGRIEGVGYDTVDRALGDSLIEILTVAAVVDGSKTRGRASGIIQQVAFDRWRVFVSVRPLLGTDFALEDACFLVMRVLVLPCVRSRCSCFRQRWFHRWGWLDFFPLKETDVSLQAAGQTAHYC